MEHKKRSGLISFKAPSKKELKIISNEPRTFLKFKVFNLKYGSNSRSDKHATQLFIKNMLRSAGSRTTNEANSVCKSNYYRFR